MPILLVDLVALARSAQGPDVAPQHPDRCRTRAVDAEDALEQGRLPGPAPAENDHDLAALDCHAHAVQDALVVEAGDEVLHLHDDVGSRGRDARLRPSTEASRSVIADPVVAASPLPVRRLPGRGWEGLPHRWRAAILDRSTPLRTRGHRHAAAPRRDLHRSASPRRRLRRHAEDDRGPPGAHSAPRGPRGPARRAPRSGSAPTWTWRTATA